MNAPILVTGAAGFIGFHVARALLDAGNAVVGIDTLNAYYDPALKRARLAQLQGRDGWQFAMTDCADAVAINALFEAHGFTLVVHLAAQAGVRHGLDHPHDFIQANVAGFLTVLEACRHHGVTHLVYASSSSVYGANRALPFSEHAGASHPVSLYGATKKAGEMMAHAYAQCFALPVTGLRFFTVYGPWGRPDMAMFSFTRKILAGEEIELFNFGRHARDFTYIDDIVEGVVRLVAHPPAGDPAFDPLHPDPAISAAPYRLYNIGNHAPVELGDFIAAIEAATGRTAITRGVPMQPGDVLETFADVADLAAAVRFAPATPIGEGVARFVAWYRDYYGV